jgi:hypothetical protein
MSHSFLESLLLWIGLGDRMRKFMGSMRTEVTLRGIMPTFVDDHPHAHFNDETDY